MGNANSLPIASLFSMLKLLKFYFVIGIYTQAYSCGWNDLNHWKDMCHYRAEYRFTCFILKVTEFSVFITINVWQLAHVK